MEKKTTILVSISSGIIARNFLTIPSGFLAHAKNAFKTIILIVPNNTGDFYKTNYADEQIIVETVPENNFQFEDNSFLKKVFSFFYTYLLFSENAKGLAWEGVYFKMRPKDTWSGRMTYPIKWVIGNTFGKSKWIRIKFVPWMDSVLHREEFYTNYFEKYKPDVVFCPNVEKWQDICLIREAKKWGVPSVGMPGSWDHLPKRFRPLHPDHLLASTYTQKNEAVVYQSYAESQVFVVGVPYYDGFVLKHLLKTRKEFCQETGLDPKKKIVFFSSESVYSPDDDDIADLLYRWVCENKIEREAQLVIRPYPGVTTEHDKFDFLQDKEGVYIDWIENKLKRTNNDAWYPSIEDISHFMNILSHSDVVINTYSSIAIEAAYFNKQAIWINFDGYKNRPWDMSVKRFSKKLHLKNILETDAVRLVESQDELLIAINEILTQEVIDPKVEILRHKMCGPIDGRTGERIATFLAKVI